MPMQEPPAAPGPADMASTPAMGAPAAAPAANAARPAPAAPAGGGNKRANVMTMMAGTAMGVAEAFNAGFKQPFPGWSGHLAEPMGPSTGGGKQALQPITITSGAGEKLTIGRVDPVRRSVTLRTYHVVNAMHAQRYSRPLPVSAEDYERFMQTVTTFFKAMQFGVTEERYVPRTRSAPPDAGDDSRTLRLLLLLLVVIILALVAYIFATR
jgi:hypothetical protein